jgi:hypothetical protein
MLEIKTVLDYRKLMDRLLNISSCALLTTGRTGTDLLQSLLDSHPQVLVFNGPLFYHDFWNASMCVSAGDFKLSDFIDEFIGKHIEKLKSQYDIREGRHQLGEDYNQSLNIDLRRFKYEITKLLEGRKVNSKNSMLAVYASYAICLGQDIRKKTLLLHHIHHSEKLGRYLQDFPDSKIICMTRDPRANFVSGIEHWRRFDPSTDCESHLYYFIHRILDDAGRLAKYKNDYMIVRIENLGEEDILIKLCEWLDIPFDACLRKSSWGGLVWHGDLVSAKRNKGSGWSKDILVNRWEERLSSKDKYILNYLMFHRLKYYGYNYKEAHLLDAVVMPFLILLPLSYEGRFFSMRYIRDYLKNKRYRTLLDNIVFYLFRIRLFMRYYLKAVRKEGFEHPFLSHTGTDS